MKNNNLVLISSDIEPGGISTMIGIHTAALIKEGYKVTVISVSYTHLTLPTNREV